jgi:hypothetical protein
VTVLWGEARVGFGDKLDVKKAKVFPAGSYYVNPPDSHHYLYFPRTTVLQMTGEGPWELTILYVPEAEERQWTADLAVCDYMERGDDHLPDDLLEGWIGSVSLYDGDCSPIYPTEARNSEAVAIRVLEIIQARNAFPDPPVP